MFNYDYGVPKEDLNSAIVQELRILGVKHVSIPKKTSKSSQASKAVASRGCVFHKPLHLLSSRIVQLQSSVEAEVPNFIQELCYCVIQQADTEGIFRKAGSTARQKELRTLLDQGYKIQPSEHHVVDVANVLKYFLRELPEPVLPYAYHDLLLHCLLTEESASAVLLACLLLPRPHLYVLAYLMEFFHLVAGLSDSNKMTFGNLAIVITPSLMPVSEKISVIQNPQRVGAHVRVVEILIANAERIGVLPDSVVGKLSLAPSASNISVSSDDPVSGAAFSMKKKRRRSGSLTRMFNGIKKIVAGKPSPGIDSNHSGMLDEAAAATSCSANFSTPCVKSGKKRKALETSSAFSSKKKRDVLMALPQSTALADTPFKKTLTCMSDSSETPLVSANPNPPSTSKSKSKSPQKNKHRRFFPSRTFSESDNHKTGTSPKKGLSGVSNFVIKKQKQRVERHSTSGNFLERSWSAVSNSNWGRKKMHRSDQARLSFASTSTAYAPIESDSSHDADIGIDLSQEEDPFDSTPSDFVQLPKSEYEDLKSRMSAIESCISKEFSSVSTGESGASPQNLNAANTLLAVQTVYEKTLEDADVAKDASTDQLAKRLSRELKIRRSAECKVIRSPSARKIGSLRRRSRERQSPSLRRELRRNKSWHMMQRPINVSLSTTVSSEEIPMAQSSRLRRGRPNTVFSGLPQPTPNRISKEVKPDVTSILNSDSSPVTRSQTRRASSFNGSVPASPAILFSKKCRSQVNLAKAALLAHAQQRSKANMETDEKWRDAQELLDSSAAVLSPALITGRESIAKLRSENAGKVLATAKLFSGSTDTTKSSELRRSKVHETVPSRASPASRKESVSPKTKSRYSENSHMNDFIGKPTKPSKQNFELLVDPSSIARHEKNSSNKACPVVSAHSKKLKTRVSPTQSPTIRNTNNKVKKHSSLKVGRQAHSQPVKRNLSVPVQRIDLGKENHVDKSVHLSRGLSPQGVKESLPLTKRIQRISVSPLKDCNRITAQPPSSQSMKYSALSQCATPSIKQPLTVLTPRRKTFTPQTNCGSSLNTPLKVTATPSMKPIYSAHRISRMQQCTKASVKGPGPCN